MLNPNGRTAKDYWCAIFPPGADNKSFAPQIGAIVLSRGMEFCFCLGAGAGEFRNADDRLRNERYFDAVRQRLRELPESFREQLRALPEEWKFRTRWRLPDAVGEFDTADDWLAFAGSDEGAGASISKYLSVQQTIERGPRLAADFREVIETFGKLLLHLDGARVAARAPVRTTPKHDAPRLWIIGAGEGGRLWDRFRNDGEIAMGMSPLGDLSQYRTKEQAAAALRAARGDDIEPINDGLACYEFVHVMRPGDRVYAKRGLDQVLGVGTVVSEYLYDPNRSEYKNVRKVRWSAVGEWRVPTDVRFAVKTLTEVTRYESLLRTLDRLIGAGEGERVIAAPAALQPADEEPLFTVDDGLADTFMGRDEWLRTLAAWSRKKNLILQGSPGVGKTFLARRLAYSLLGRKSPRRVAILQFHQSYSYEEFVEGDRPSPNRGLELRDGFFKTFCAAASADPANGYVLIIDEINRGNVSRIFGELLSLIEADKEGTGIRNPACLRRPQVGTVPRASESLHPWVDEHCRPLVGIRRLRAASPVRIPNDFARVRSGAIRRLSAGARRTGANRCESGRPFDEAESNDLGRRAEPRSWIPDWPFIFLRSAHRRSPRRVVVPRCR
jgi:hypothetical protein